MSVGWALGMVCSIFHAFYRSRLKRLICIRQTFHRRFRRFWCVRQSLRAYGLPGTAGPDLARIIPKLIRLRLEIRLKFGRSVVAKL